METEMTVFLAKKVDICATNSELSNNCKHSSNINDNDDDNKQQTTTTTYYSVQLQKPALPIAALLREVPMYLWK